MTPCRIGAFLPDGSVKTIRCKYDGYPSGVGKWLIENVKDEYQVHSMINRGDALSVIANRYLAGAMTTPCEWDELKPKEMPFEEFILSERYTYVYDFRTKLWYTGEEWASKYSAE